MKPDYAGFGEHLLEWESVGIPYGTSDLVNLAKIYSTPIPGTPEWTAEFSKKDNDDK